MRDMSLSATVSTLTLMGFTAMSLGSCESVDYVEAFETEASITRIIVNADVGDLVVIGGERDTVRVERRVDGWKGGIDLTSQLVDGELTLDARCTGFLGCRVDTTLEVPAGAEIVVAVGEGEITLTNLSGPVSVDLASGDVSGHGLIASAVDATVTSGDVLLQFDRAPTLVSAALASGDLFLQLPGELVDAALDLAGGEAVLDNVALLDDVSLLGAVGRAGSRVEVISAGGDVYLTGTAAR